MYNTSNIFCSPETLNTSQPTIFLAGPIQGAPMWHEEAIKMIHEVNPDVVIASPRRRVMPDPAFDYDEQVKWETEYLNKAGKNGVILFWLAKELEHVEGRQYAQTTRHEIAEWITKHQLTGAKIVIGIEDGFVGDRYIRTRLANECPEITIHSDLKSLCHEAVSQITNI